MATKQEISDVAQRAIDDPEYARQVLEGDEHPEVREALAKDLGEEEAEVTGFLNPQPLPPRDWNWSVLIGRWSSLRFASTRSIIVVGGR
jgi:hypothetical protein